ncbi:dienelactone hydrolase family protein [Actinomadura flavalba]|uniref:dienelactone hydrolase family protein n=1 Tax=Actinomadura flavalba TaxID=1120938 RepID=UPI0003717394|nr:dienelactone hydrolase family protein [Actinomadura flavalba]
MVSYSPRYKAVAFTVAAGLVGGGLAGLAPNRHERGPDPTRALLEAPRGPLATARTVVPRAEAAGYGGGTIYHPAEMRTGETYGAVAIIPGRNGPQSGMSWYGPRLASHGFIVFTIDALRPLDRPPARGAQLQAALQQLAVRSPVATHVDAGRLAVMGHSLGGAGALEAAKARPGLRAAIPLTPSDVAGPDFSGVRVPTLILAAEKDTVAPLGRHARKFYRAIPRGTEKAYVELAGATHGFPKLPHPTVARYTIAWLKRWVDGDRRYDRVLCPSGRREPAVSFQRDTCPHD